MATQQKQKKKQNNKGKQQNVLARTGRATMVAAPASFGVQLPQMGLRMSGVPQALTDRGELIGIRLVGSDLLSIAIQAGGTDNCGFGAGTYGNFLSPTGVSPRLEQFEELFQFYAFRKVRIVYTNDVGSGTAGSVAVGLVTDSLTPLTEDSPITQQQILELPYARKTAVWEPAVMFEYEHTGTRLWTTSSLDDSGTQGYLDWAQGTILAAFNGTLEAASYGTLAVDYVIDFYQPTPPFTNDPALSLRRLLGKAKRKGKIDVLRKAMTDYLASTDPDSWESVPRSRESKERKR